MLVKGAQAGVEAKVSVEVDGGPLRVIVSGFWYCDGASEFAVVFVAMRNDEVEAVGPSSQEDDDEGLPFGDGCGLCGIIRRMVFLRCDGSGGVVFRGVRRQR